MKPPMKMPPKPPSNGKTSDPEVNSGGAMDGDQDEDRARRKQKLAGLVAEGGKW